MDTQQNYLLMDISFKCNKSISDIILLCEEKTKELHGLVSFTGAIYIIANDLGVRIGEYADKEIKQLSYSHEHNNNLINVLNQVVDTLKSIDNTLSHKDQPLFNTNTKLENINNSLGEIADILKYKGDC